MEDKKLVSKILNGEKQAFATFIGNYQRLVMHIIVRMVDDSQDREEIVQDVFVKAFQKIGDFNFQSKLSTWVATIAYRHAVNFLKKNRNWKMVEDLDSVDYNFGVEQKGYEAQDSANFVQQAIDKLPTQYRTILTLYHLDGFSYPEIMEITAMPEGTVKNYLFRARKKLKELLEPYLEQEVLLE